MTSLTWSHTSNGDPLVVLLAVDQATTPKRGAISVTFNGTPLKPGGSILTGSVYVMEWWYLAAPGSATANIVATQFLTGWISGCAHNVTNANFSIGVGAFGAANGSSTTPSVTVNSITNSLVLDIVASDNANQTFSQGGGQTKIYDQVDATTNVKTAGSEAAGGASSTTMSWTLGSSDTWAQAALTLSDPATTGTMRISQVPAEVAVSAGSIRLSQLAVEVLTPSGVSNQRLSQLAIEVATRQAEIRLSQLAIEVVSANAVPRRRRRGPVGSGGAALE